MTRSAKIRHLDKIYNAPLNKSCLGSAIKYLNFATFTAITEGTNT